MYLPGDFIYALVFAQNLGEIPFNSRIDIISFYMYLLSRFSLLNYNWFDS